MTDQSREYEIRKRDIGHWIPDQVHLDRRELLRLLDEARRERDSLLADRARERWCRNPGECKQTTNEREAFKARAEKAEQEVAALREAHGKVCRSLDMFRADYLKAREEADGLMKHIDEHCAEKDALKARLDESVEATTQWASNYNAACMERDDALAKLAASEKAREEAEAMVNLLTASIEEVTGRGVIEIALDGKR